MKHTIEDFVVLWGDFSGATEFILAGEAKNVSSGIEVWRVIVFELAQGQALKCW
jgi:hypothetical protein